MSTSVLRFAPPARTRPARPAPVTPNPHGRHEVAATLPGRQELLDHLARLQPTSHEAAGTLLLIGLVHTEATVYPAATVLDTATSLISYALREGDLLGRAGPAEFAAVVQGSDADADAAAARVLAAVGAARIPGLTVAAGTAALQPDRRPAEILRRATLSLTVARSIGGGQVIRYRGSR
ncbi:diguanylate cyclase [Modestobacter sp. I12A-02628]|uniref:Diguanylate cyclase n=1 Tax=Goekera deserti TaxID=2497753 RepID=A0A7K3WF59_9ACTN|nr:diguanylate cyclase [Goekera deserti]MPQ97901.1 diguanylate cyclase [Goekera deserti]NDI48547.1 diguanylate cyclase [Goekera deserti]NEL55074.1 diguanylate cyclase [Goekera deserti]